MRKCPRTEWAARDTTSQSVDHHVAITACWAAARCIPSCEEVNDGAPVMVIHSSEPLILRRVSS
jgi:hypothetical protein